MNTDKTDLIDPVDRKFIKIFNNYKKTRINFRKKKMTLNYQKRLAKKKFFKVKKLERHSAVRDLQKNPIQETLEKTPTNLRKPAVPTVSTENPILLNKVLEIVNMNRVFLNIFQRNMSFDFSRDLEIFKHHMAMVGKYFQK